MSSPQAVIQNVHIKLKSNSQTQRSACIQYREHLHCMLRGHAQRSSSQVIVTDIVSSSSLHLSKNRSQFFTAWTKFLFGRMYIHMCISVYIRKTTLTGWHMCIFRNIFSTGSLRSSSSVLSVSVDDELTVSTASNGDGLVPSTLQLLWKTQELELEAWLLYGHHLWLTWKCLKNSRNSNKNQSKNFGSWETAAKDAPET